LRDEDSAETDLVAASSLTQDKAIIDELARVRLKIDSRDSTFTEHLL